MKFGFLFSLIILLFSCSNSKKISNNTISGVIDGRFDSITFLDTSYRIIDNLEGDILHYKVDTSNDSLKIYDLEIMKNGKWSKSIFLTIDKKTGELLNLQLRDPNSINSKNIFIEKDSTNQFRFK